jgi:predicted ferric reductase
MYISLIFAMHVQIGRMDYFAHGISSGRNISRDNKAASVAMISTDSYSYAIPPESGFIFPTLISKNSAVFFLCCVFLPFLLFATLAIPNNWQYLSLSNIRAEQQTEEPSEYGTCWQLKVSEHLILKLYPDILIYYVFIYSVTSLGLLAQIYPQLRRFLHARPMKVLHTGEALAAFALVLVIAGEMCYWYYDHWWQGYPRKVYSAEEMAARSVGQVANILAGLLTLPIARNSVWTQALGISWDGMVVYHTYLGGLFIITIGVHAALFWKVFDVEGFLPHDIFAVPMYFHGDNFTIPLATVTGFFTLLLMAGGSFYIVRRKHYEVFYVLHHFSMIIFAMMLWHAAMAWYYILPGLILWTADHCLRLSKCLGIHVKIDHMDVEGNGNVVSIGYTVQNMSQRIYRYLSGRKDSRPGPLKYSVGQYCFLNIPQISALEWHPFSISSAPEDDITTHHIKAMGQGQWTGKLVDFAYEINANLSSEKSLLDIVINVDGPYGLNIPIANYSRFCFIAGGIGITPLHSYVRHLYLCMKSSGLHSSTLELSSTFLDQSKLGGISGGVQSTTNSLYSHIKQVRLIWIVRTMEESILFDKTLQLLENDNLNGVFSYAVYITQGVGRKANAPWRHGSFIGRPDIRAEIAGDLISTHHHMITAHCQKNNTYRFSSLDFSKYNEDSIAFACGPKPLVHIYLFLFHLQRLQLLIWYIYL